MKRIQKHFEADLDEAAMEAVVEDMNRYLQNKYPGVSYVMILSTNGKNGKHHVSSLGSSIDRRQIHEFLQEAADKFAGSSN